MTYMFILKCALKLVEEIILYYDARSKKHQTNTRCIKVIYSAVHIYIITDIEKGPLGKKMHVC